MKQVNSTKKGLSNPYIRGQRMASYLLGRKDFVEQRAIQLAQNPDNLDKLALIDTVISNDRYYSISDKFEAKFIKEMVSGKGNLKTFSSMLEKLEILSNEANKSESPLVLSWQEELFNHSVKLYNDIIKEVLSIEDISEKEKKLLDIFGANYTDVAEKNLRGDDGNNIFSLSCAGNDNINFLSLDTFETVEKFLADEYYDTDECFEVDAVYVNREIEKDKIRDAWLDEHGEDLDNALNESDLRLQSLKTVTDEEYDFDDEEDYDNNGLPTPLDMHIASFHKNHR